MIFLCLLFQNLIILSFSNEKCFLPCKTCLSQERQNCFSCIENFYFQEENLQNEKCVKNCEENSINSNFSFISNYKFIEIINHYSISSSNLERFHIDYEPIKKFNKFYSKENFFFFTLDSQFPFG